MSKNKKVLKESITTSAISPFSYIVLIDCISAIDKNRGYIQMIFPNESLDVIRGMFRKVFDSQNYAKSKESLQSISSRFSNNPALKVLFQSLRKLKSASYPMAEKESHEKDIQTIIEKISTFIKRRLTDEDDKILENLLSEINHVSERISKKINDEVLSLGIKEEEPIEEPKDTKQKTEVKVNERIKNKLRKKIKEIIRTHLIKRH